MGICEHGGEIRYEERDHSYGGTADERASRWAMARTIALGAWEGPVYTGVAERAARPCAAVRRPSNPHPHSELRRDRVCPRGCVFRRPANGSLGRSGDEANLAVSVPAPSVALQTAVILAENAISAAVSLTALASSAGNHAASARDSCSLVCGGNAGQNRLPPADGLECRTADSGESEELSPGP